MKRDPLSIIKEYVRSDKPQVRKNALTALRVIGSKESVTELINIALHDEEKDVRDRAEEELMRVTIDNAPIVNSLIGETLKDEGRQKPSYALLGRLRSKGVSLNIPPFPLLSRIKWAAVLVTQLYPVRHFRFRVRTLLPAFFGALVGILFTGFMLGQFANIVPDVRLNTEEYLILFIISIVITLLLTLVASQRSISINLYADRLAGSIVQTIGVMIGPFILYSIVLQSYSFFFHGEFTIKELVMMVMIAPLFVAGVRMGTIVAFGIFTVPRLNRNTQMVLGAAGGFIVLTVLTSIIEPHIGSEVANVQWILLLPTGFGVARAFAKIDNETIPIGPIIRYGARPLCCVILSAFLIPLIIVMSPIQQVPEMTSNQLSAISGEYAEKEWEIDQIPKTIYFQVSFKQRVKAWLPSQYLGYPWEYLTLDLFTLDLYGARGKIAEGFNPTKIDIELEKGNYSLVVRHRYRNPSLSPEHIYTTLSNRISGREIIRNKIKPFKLNIRLNVEKTKK